jgi:hypothetical protein
MGLFSRLMYYLEECSPFRKSPVEQLLSQWEREEAVPYVKYNRAVAHF